LGSSDGDDRGEDVGLIWGVTAAGLRVGSGFGKILWVVGISFVRTWFRGRAITAR
jgi:hypothetical protein